MGNEPSKEDSGRSRRFSKQGSSRRSVDATPAVEEDVHNDTTTKEDSTPTITAVDEEAPAAVPNESNEQEEPDENDTLQIAETDDSETTEQVSNVTSHLPKKWTPDTTAEVVSPLQPNTTDDSDEAIDLEQPPNEDEEEELDKVICAEPKNRSQEQRTIQCLHGVACVSAVCGIALFALAGVCGWGGHCGL